MTQQGGFSKPALSFSKYWILLIKQKQQHVSHLRVVILACSSAGFNSKSDKQQSVTAQSFNLCQFFGALLQLEVGGDGVLLLNSCRLQGRTCVGVELPVN